MVWHAVDDTAVSPTHGTVSHNTCMVVHGTAARGLGGTRRCLLLPVPGYESQSWNIHQIATERAGACVTMILDGLGVLIRFIYFVEVP